LQAFQVGVEMCLTFRSWVDSTMLKMCIAYVFLVDRSTQLRLPQLPEYLLYAIPFLPKLLYNRIIFRPTSSPPQYTGIFTLMKLLRQCIPRSASYERSHGCALNAHHALSPLLPLPYPSRSPTQGFSSAAHSTSANNADYETSRSPKTPASLPPSHSS
jgi:hypothetical protein